MAQGNLPIGEVEKAKLILTSSDKEYAFPEVLEQHCRHAGQPTGPSEKYITVQC